MTRRLFLLAAATAPVAELIIADEVPSWVRKPGGDCAHCGEKPDGAEGTIWCADCLQWYRERYSVEWVRMRPSAGDVITGPNGMRVEVTEVLTQTLSDGSHIEMVYYTKSHPEHGHLALIARMEQWQNMGDWDKARIG